MVSKEVENMVTDHAVIRFLERVEGYDFQDVKDELKAKGLDDNDERLLLTELYRKYGLTRGHVSYKIAPKEVRLAIKAGAIRIKRGNFVWIVRDGAIITIEPRKSYVGRVERYKRKTGRDQRRKDRTVYTYLRGQKMRVVESEH